MRNLEDLIGADLESKLDLHPSHDYEENIEALESLAAGDYEAVSEAVSDMNPRVFHESFRNSYMRDFDPVKVDSEALEDIEEVLEDNSEKKRSWLGEKLFHLGYIQPSYAENSRDIFDNPSINYGPDIVPEVNTGLPSNPYRDGKKQRAGDEHYLMASRFMLADIGDREISIL